MSTNQILVAIIGICIILIIAGYILEKPERILKMVSRCVIGVIAIYCTNKFLDIRNVDIGVGINIFTSATVAILGAPGYVLLYGIAYILK